MAERRRYKRINYFAPNEFVETSVLKSWCNAIRRQDIQNYKLGAENGYTNRQDDEQREEVIACDGVKARLQIDSNCCCRTPVRPKDNIDKYIEIE